MQAFCLEGDRSRFIAFLLSWTTDVDIVGVNGRCPLRKCVVTLEEIGTNIFFPQAK